MAAHVFISYSRTDRSSAQRLAEFLTGSGIAVWYDHEVQPGDRFSKRIQDAIDGCAAFVLLVSSASNASEWVGRELGYALSRRKPVLPIRIEDCPLSIEVANLDLVDIRGVAPPPRRFVDRLRVLVDEFMPPPVEGATKACTHASSESARLKNLYNFAYLFTRADQLETGAWGASVVPWMIEIGRDRPGFSLHEQIFTEGGIETTASCCTALTMAWRPQAINAREWARRARAYFRRRQSHEGSIGYLLPLYRQDEWSIQTTLRHTALGSICLTQLGDSAAARHALRFVLERVAPVGNRSPQAISDHSAKLDNHPAMLMAATLRAMQFLHRDSGDDFDNLVEPILLALSRLDESSYPFFKPYGSLPPMHWYTFLSVVDSISELPLGPIGDRISEGLHQILGHFREGGLPFSTRARASDYGLTSLLLGVLRSPRVVDALDELALPLAHRAQQEAESWLATSIDSYARAPNVFAFTQSGTVARLLRESPCECLLVSPSRLATMDALCLDLRASYEIGDATEQRGKLIRESRCLEDVEFAAVAALLDDKAFGTDKRAPTTVKSAKHTANAYALIAKDYARLWTRSANLDEDALGSFTAALAPGSAILDAGCGVGQYTQRFAAAGHRALGVDISLGVLNEAVALYGQRVFACADLRQLPLRTASFDGIWAFASLVHVPKELVPDVLDEFRRVLHAEGILYVNVPLGHFDRVETPAQFDRRGQWGRFFQRYANRIVFEAILADAGFTIRHYSETTVKSDTLPAAGTHVAKWMRFIAARA
jgi:SAM-dependent methyltransferase